MPGLNAPMYDPRLVQPMREELTRIGFQELRTPAEVDDLLGTAKDTTLVVVNSVCGCAARNARPAATLALQHARRPKRLLTVFAGQDAAATERARSYRSEERRVGKECRSRWARYHEKKNTGGRGARWKWVIIERHT